MEQSDYNATGVSSDNVTDSEESVYFFKTEHLAFLTFLFAMTVVGNFCVIVFIIKDTRQKNRQISRLHFFIIHLACADLSIGFITVLTDIIWKATETWLAGVAICKVVRFLQSLTTFASTFVLVGMSIDRFYTVARPMQFYSARKRARIMVYLAWIAAASSKILFKIFILALFIVFSVPMLFLNSTKLVSGIMQCWITMPQRWHWKLYMTILALVLFIIPALVIAVCYTVIVFIIWTKGRKELFSSRERQKQDVELTLNGNRLAQSETSGTGVIPKAKIKTIRMTFVIVLVFILCWSPYFVFDLLDVYGHIAYSQTKVAVAIFIQSLATLNSAANPVIFFLFSADTCSNSRNRRGLFQCCKCCKLTSLHNERSELRHMLSK